MDTSAMSLVNINEVNHYFDRLLVADAKLTAIVVDNLYRMALKQSAQIRNNCWFNFVAVMTVNVTRHIWNKVPKLQQSEELFERLVTPNISVSSLLDGFNPQYQASLLLGLVESVSTRKIGSRSRNLLMPLKVASLVA
jgi:hypothetical protein